MPFPRVPIRRCAAGLLAFWLLAQPGFGASTASPAAATGPRVRVEERDGFAWLTGPDTPRFFSLGVNCVDRGPARDDDDPENPGYAAWRHYESPAAWAGAVLGRLREAGFTTLGGWCELPVLRAVPDQRLWLTPVLHIGSTAGAPWWDMWDPKNLRRMEEVAKRQILELRGDPRVLGYYSDNELGWWNATLWKMTLEQAPSSGQRQRLVRLLRREYHDDWTALRRDFDVEQAGRWSELERRGMLFLKPGGQGVRVMRTFLGLLADRYYQLMRELIRRYDPAALYLGDRYQSFYYPEVAAAAAPYVDLISSNLNAPWADGTFLRCYLDTLHALAGHPVLISEFYAAARENRSGNRNNSGVYPVVATQTARAATARQTLLGLLRLPYVAGADWFQHADEPTHGRADGENYNFGLVDIHDEPYGEVLRVFRELDPVATRARGWTKRPDASQGVPPAPADPFADFVATRALLGWDRERGFVPPSSPQPVADLYAGWKSGALYLGLYAFDIVEAAYYRGGSVPKSDRAEWIVQVNDGEPLRARIGAGREPLVNDPAVRVENLSGVDLNVRNIAAVELPARRAGVASFKAGDTVRLAVTLRTHLGAYQVAWRGTFPLVD